MFLWECTSFVVFDGLILQHYFYFVNSFLKIIL